MKKFLILIAVVAAGICFSGCPASNQIDPPTHWPDGQIMVTIDDGPSPDFEKILDFLSGTENKVTFFVCGERCLEPGMFDLLVRAVKEGHRLGNHAYNFPHPNFADLTSAEADEQVRKTKIILTQVYAAAGVKDPLLFRFPFGSESNLNAPIKAGYKVVRWDVDPLDYNIPYGLATVEQVQNRCTHTMTGDIILLHDLPATAEEIIPFVLSRYTSVVVERSYI